MYYDVSNTLNTLNALNALNALNIVEGVGSVMNIRKTVERLEEYLSDTLLSTELEEKIINAIENKKDSGYYALDTIVVCEHVMNVIYYKNPPHNINGNNGVKNIFSDKNNYWIRFYINALSFNRNFSIINNSRTDLHSDTIRSETTVQEIEELVFELTLLYGKFNEFQLLILYVLYKKYLNLVHNGHTLIFEVLDEPNEKYFMDSLGEICIL